MSAMVGHRAAEVGVEAMRRLAAYGVVDIQRGLRDSEFDAICARYGFTFADDHRALLTGGLPTGPGWPDWRSSDQRAVRDQLAWPVQGVLFDVQHKGFWHRAWGECPERRDEALAVAEAALAGVPRMVPLLGHRYLPAGAGSAPHPILQMFRSEIRIFGVDLADWVVQEFGTAPLPEKVPAVTVEFWGELL
jgi:hypothetical protein